MEHRQGRERFANLIFSEKGTTAPDLSENQYVTKGSFWPLSSLRLIPLWQEINLRERSMEHQQGRERTRSWRTFNKRHLFHHFT